jgi:hypothetical protein
MLNETENTPNTPLNDNKTIKSTQSVQASYPKDNNTPIKILIALGVILVILLSLVLINLLHNNNSNNLNSSLSGVSTPKSTTAHILETTTTTTETQTLHEETTLETTTAQTVPPIDETEPNYEDPSVGHPISQTYKTYFNEKNGFTAQYPDNFYLTNFSFNGNGCEATDGCAVATMAGYYNTTYDTTEYLYYDELSKISEPIHYQLLKDDYYIISWFENDNVRYRKVYVNSKVIIYLDFTYPSEYKCYYDDLINNMVTKVDIMLY